MYSKSEKPNKSNDLWEIEVEKGVFGAQVLEFPDLATGNRSNESGEGEEVPTTLPLRLFDDVFAVVLDNDGRRVEVNGAPSRDLGEHVVGECQRFQPLPLYCFRVRDVLLFRFFLLLRLPSPHCSASLFFSPLARGNKGPSLPCEIVRGNLVKVFGGKKGISYILILFIKIL